MTNIIYTYAVGVPFHSCYCCDISKPDMDCIR